jgi:hypothetical protein
MLRELSDNANSILEWTVDDMFSIPAEEVEQFRLRAARSLFEDLRPKLPFLSKLADNQGVTEINTLDDLVPVLFKHTVYKSYPLSLLERNQFDRLTGWLDQLTIHDLSSIDASGVERIDDWIDLIDRESPVRITTSSATGGKLSFLPRSTSETAPYERVFFLFMEAFRDEPGVDLTGVHIPIVTLGYRYGSNAMQRRLNRFVETIALSEDRCIALFPGRLSCDVQSLAGRLRAAEERGERGQVAISESLLKRRDEFIALQQDRPRQIERFVSRLVEEVPGEQVVISGTLNSYLDVMFEAERRGLSGLFAPTTAIIAGGGFKGRTDMPEDWYERVCAVLGVESLPLCYGMTELMPYIKGCGWQHFHIPPYSLPYVLDPDNGNPYPRTGVHTGRFAFIDLLASSYWGGFVSGDEVTIHWDDQCPCGRTGAYLENAFQRYSVLRGGDDKISCAGVAEAHDKALDYLLEGL